ncbi:MAG: hypothetical protein IPH16_19180 [Haliscomenobacter sp.]|nr:hypothetical protein [Haliscomenobacter sp.]
MNSGIFKIYDFREVGSGWRVYLWGEIPNTRKSMMSLQRFFPCLFFLFGACLLSGQQYTLTVENGYGSGQYAPGDTVHIWAEEWLPGQTFKNWTGQTVWLKSAEEWHTTLLMPARNITVRANKQDLPQGAILLRKASGGATP